MTRSPEMGSRRWAAERLHSLLTLDVVGDWLDAIGDQQLRGDLANVIERARLIGANELDGEAS